MNQYRTFALLCIAVIFMLLTNSCQCKQPEQPRLNVLFFLVDDLGWKDLSCQGSEFYETPNIDKLAQKGMFFNQAYATHPRCAASRYSLMTGKYPARIQSPGPGECKLDPAEFTVAEAFKEAGYQTFFAGKWHLAKKGSFPDNQGFDINIAGGHPGAPGTYFYPYNKENMHEGPIEGLEDGAPGEYLTDRLTAETIQFIRSNKNKPFFAYLSHYGVHTPLEAKKEYIEKYKNKLNKMEFSGPEFIVEGTGKTKMRQDDPVYAAMIQSMDESLGSLIQVLKEEGIADRTAIVLFSDNGGLSNKGWKNRRLATSNLPLRAGKGHLYEGGVREPMIVYWPGVTNREKRSEAIITGTDFYPTLLEIAGIELKPEQHLDGESFVWAIRGENNPNPERSFFWHSPEPRPQNTGDLSSTSVRQGNFKLIDFYEENRMELYNLKDDIGEKNNIADKMPEKAMVLLRQIRNWRKEVNAFVNNK